MTFRAFWFAFALLPALIAAAQDSGPDTGVSETTLKTLKALAWQSLPTKIVQGGAKVLEIDKSDPSKIIVPDADAREVVEAAHLTARAQRCDLQELVIASRDALLSRMKKTGRWSESQLQYINTLHLFTVQLLAGKTGAGEAEKPRAADSAGSAPLVIDTPCSDAEKQDITSAVEARERS
jgi:hypothetical protein